MARKKKHYEKYRKKNPEKEKRNKTFTIIIAAILIVMILAQIGLFQERRKLEAEKTKIEKQISSEEERTKELKKTQKYMTTDEYIEKVAREKFGLFYPDEYVLEEE